MGNRAYLSSRRHRDSQSQTKRTLVRLGPWLVVGGLVLFQAINNWLWLESNVTMAGWDKPRHLAHSLNYAQMLSPVSLESLFEVMVSDPIRPPLFPASASVMYALFGRTADIATMINIFYMAIALAATYALGRRWGGWRVGLAAAVLLSLFPMFYAMSRHFYLEFALTAMVALTAYLVAASDGFERRGVSLLFGLSLGLGLLTKRTFAVFVIGPVLVVVLTSGLLPALWQSVKRRPHIYWTKLLIAVVGGLVLAGLWYLPNRLAAQELILGDRLFLLWWSLAALAIYFAILTSTALANALSAMFLAAGVASTWYLARIEFVKRVALYGYGINDPRGRALRLEQIDTYLYYLRKLGNEHLSSLLLAGGLVVVVLAFILFARQQGSVRQALKRIRPEGWIVAAWLGGGYLLLTFSIYQETRAFTPALPAVALLFGAAVFKLPWRWIRRSILALAIGFGLLQFLVLTYEPIYHALPPTAVRLPGWGPTMSFAQGGFIQLPDEGQTESGYWIVPDVLQQMEAYRLATGQETASLGLLANTSQVNTGPFIYQILTEYPNLRVESLVDGSDEPWANRRLLDHDFVAIARVNENITPAQDQAIAALLNEPPPEFAQSVELAHTVTLPDGNEVYLYQQRYHLPSDYPTGHLSELAKTLGDQTRTGDAIILTPPEIASTFISQYAGPANIYVELDDKGDLSGIASQHGRVFLILGDTGTGQLQENVGDWLKRNGFWASHEWTGGLQTLVYGTVSGLPAATPSVRAGAVLGEEIELVGYDLPKGTWVPGDILPLSLFWQRVAPVDKDYSIFVHLLDAGGQITAQTDAVAVGGSRLTSSWRDGELIVDRHGLRLPDNTEAGEYKLLVGMYFPETGERLSARGQNGKDLGDAVELAPISVVFP